MSDINETMYTLGQLARAVYPAGDIPSPILDSLLSAPAIGLGLLAKSPPARDMRRTLDKHADYDALVARLPADLTRGPVPVADQGSFWTGWYHHLKAIERAQKLGPEHLARAGTLLYGERWQSELARAMGIGDRRVREWIAGERRPPAGVWADISALLRQRQSEGLALLRELDNGAA